MILIHLRSYQHMGQARVSCVAGCACEASVVESHHPQEHASQLSLHEVEVSQSAQCVVELEVLSTTVSGEHKVKFTGFALSEMPEAGHAFPTWAHDYKPQP